MLTIDASASSIQATRRKTIIPKLARQVEPVARARVGHTSVGEDAHRVDALLDLGSSERLRHGAPALRGVGVRSVIWACTSGSFVFAWDGARRQVAELGEWLGVPASSTSLALVAAATALGALGRSG